MVQSLTRPVLRADKPCDEGTVGAEATNPLPSPSPDDLRLAKRIERALHSTGYRAVRDIALRT